MTEKEPGKNPGLKVPQIKDLGETREFGLRFSSPAHVARIRKEFGLPPKSPKIT